MLQEGETIKCRDADDMRYLLKGLGEANINAVVWDQEHYIVKITKINNGED